MMNKQMGGGQPCSPPGGISSVQEPVYAAEAYVNETTMELASSI